MGDELTVYYVDLNRLDLPPEVKTAAEKFVNFQKGEGEGVLSTEDFEALDNHLRYSPEEFSSYCTAMQTLYSHIGIGNEEIPCIPGVTKFAELSKMVVSGFAMKSVSKSELAALKVLNFSEESRLAALEYVGRVLVTSMKLEDYRHNMAVNGYKISSSGDHYKIMRNDVCLEFDTQVLKSGRAAVDNMSVKRANGEAVPINEWPRLLIEILSYTKIFSDMFYCNWRLFDSGLILFGTKSSELNDFAKIYLKALSDVVYKYPRIELTIIGNADRVGDKELNKALASARAEAVRAELVRLGVRSNRLTIVSQGEEMPIDAKADNIKNPHNRNVQIIARYRYHDGRYASRIVYKQGVQGNVLLTTDLEPPKECKVSTTGTHSTFGEIDSEKEK